MFSLVSKGQAIRKDKMFITVEDITRAKKTPKTAEKLNELVRLVGEDYALHILEGQIKHIEGMNKEAGLAESHIDPHDYLSIGEYDDFITKENSQDLLGVEYEETI